MTDIPQLKLTLATNKTHKTGYHLEGWDEFDQWAYNNLVAWRDIMRQGVPYNLTEVDRLRILAWTYVTKTARANEELVKQIRDIGFTTRP